MLNPNLDALTLFFELLWFFMLSPNFNVFDLVPLHIVLGLLSMKELRLGKDQTLTLTIPCDDDLLRPRHELDNFKQ